MKTFQETFEDTIDRTDGSAVLYEEDFKCIQKHARSDLLETLRQIQNLLRAAEGDDLVAVLRTTLANHDRDIKALQMSSDMKDFHN